MRDAIDVCVREYRRVVAAVSLTFLSWDANRETNAKEGKVTILKQVSRRQCCKIGSARSARVSMQSCMCPMAISQDI